MRRLRGALQLLLCSVPVKQPKRSQKTRTGKKPIHRFRVERGTLAKDLSCSACNDATKDDGENGEGSKKGDQRSTAEEECSWSNSSTVDTLCLLQYELTYRSSYSKSDESMQTRASARNTEQAVLAAVFQTNAPTTILANILAFLPFEQQAGALRLVNRQFKAAAQSLLEEKFFDKVKVIGYDNFEGSGWFRADVRRGSWSNDNCTSLESCIAEALQWVACRCCAWDGTCAFHQSGDADANGSCMEKALQRKRYKPLKNWDMEQARMLLRTNGWFRIRKKLPNGQGSARVRPDEQSVQVRFEQGELSLDDILRQVKRSIHREVTYELMPVTFRRFYGIEDDDMSSSRFLRSLFVLFQQTSTTASAAAIRRDGAAAPSIGMTKSLIDEKGTRFYRMQMYFRFYTNANEPVEIRLQSKQDIDYAVG